MTSINSKSEKEKRLFKKSAYLAKAAYRSNTKTMRENLPNCISFGAKGIEGEDWSEAGIINYEVIEKQLNMNVVWRGTESKHDWEYNWDVKKMKTDELIREENLAVHRGFFSRWNLVKNEFRESFVRILADHRSLLPNGVNVLVTGHSLGGAMGSLCAIYLRRVFSFIISGMQIKLITFASPRVFGMRSAEKVTQFLKEDNIFRIWGSYDPVSAVAPGFIGFKHIGRMGGYKLSNFTWIFSTNLVSLHSMKNYRTEIENSILLTKYCSPWWTRGGAIKVMKKAYHYLFGSPLLEKGTVH